MVLKSVVPFLVKWEDVLEDTGYSFYLSRIFTVTENIRKQKFHHLMSDRCRLQEELLKHLTSAYWLPLRCTGIRIIVNYSKLWLFNETEMYSFGNGTSLCPIKDKKICNVLYIVHCWVFLF